MRTARSATSSPNPASKIQTETQRPEHCQGRHQDLPDGLRGIAECVRGAIDAHKKKPAGAAPGRSDELSRNVIDAVAAAFAPETRRDEFDRDIGAQVEIDAWMQIDDIARTDRREFAEIFAFREQCVEGAELAVVGVAVAAGGTAGYIWGTNGTDGVVRMNVSMAWTKDAGNGFVTLAVGDVDCGTF